MASEAELNDKQLASTNESLADSDYQCLQFDVLNWFSEHYGSLHGYFGFSICFVGSLADFAIVSVLVRRHMHSSTNMLLLWIAVTDFMTMAVCAPTYWHFYINKHPEVQLLCTLELVWIHYFVFFSSFSILCHVASIWLTVALAAFRLLYLTMQNSPVRSNSVAHAVTAVIYVWAFVATIPNILVNGYSATNTTVNETIEFLYHIDSSHLAVRYAQVQVLNFWTNALAMRIVPSLLMLAFTALLLRQMRQASKRRKRLLRRNTLRDEQRVQNRTTELRTTTMLLCVVATFLVVELPQGALAVLNYFDDCFSMSKQFRETFIAQIRRLLLADASCGPETQAATKQAETVPCERSAEPHSVTVTIAPSNGILMHSINAMMMRANGSSRLADANDPTNVALL